MKAMKTRFCVVGLISNNQGQVLICKKPDRLGVYPGQWGLPGGGIDEGEMMEEVLVREVREEVGLGIDRIKPLYFRDDIQDKFMPDGSVVKLYMVYLVFEATAVGTKVVLNDEFVEYVWVNENEVDNYDLNEPTRDSLRNKGWRVKYTITKNLIKDNDQ